MNKNDFALQPPMGWNSYDYYDTTVREADVKANADYMAENLKQHGWEYVVIDIQWYSPLAGSRRAEHQYIPFEDLEMDEFGRLQPAVNRFPSSADGRGFAPLAQYIHSLGLKFGIHIMRGIPRHAADRHMPILGTSFTADDAADPYSICPWNADMYGIKDNAAGQAYYDSIISMYAAWGVDYIKCDDICNSYLYPGDNFSGWHETEMLHKAIDRCGRAIVLSLSPGPAHIDRAWQYAKYANLWRITDDFWDNWKSLKNMFYRCELWQDHVSTGCYPDCDMLPLGMVGRGFGKERPVSFTPDEQKTMMTLWCVFRSPMMLGAELTLLDSETLKLLTNSELLAMLKDGRRGTELDRTDLFAVWKNDSADHSDRYLALFNLSETEMTAAQILSGQTDDEKEKSLPFVTRRPAESGAASQETDSASKDSRNFLPEIKKELPDLIEFLPPEVPGKSRGALEMLLSDVWEKKACTMSEFLKMNVPPHGVKLMHFSVPEAKN